METINILPWSTPFQKMHTWYCFDTSKPRNQQKPIAQSNYDQESDDTGWNASRDKMFNMQISLAGLRIFHHDSR